VRRRYAEDTKVSLSKSKAEIEDLLTAWGCAQMSWTTDNEGNQVKLEFIWRASGEAAYRARFLVAFPTDDVLRKRARHGSTGQFLPRKFEEIKARNGWPEMRQLALYLKAALNAIETGIVRAEDVFMPFMVDATGRTVAEILEPHMAKLQGGAGRLMLTAGDRP
jgi:hypothetical protein